MKTTSQIITALLLCAATSAWACETTSATAAFANKIDRNGNGEVSRKEWKKMHLNGQFERDFKRGSIKQFKELDKDGDGKLSEEEMKALKDKVRYKNAEECEAPATSSETSVVPATDNPNNPYSAIPNAEGK